jgi:hypothetical protein
MSLCTSCPSMIKEPREWQTDLCLGSEDRHKACVAMPWASGNKSRYHYSRTQQIVREWVYETATKHRSLGLKLQACPNSCVDTKVRILLDRANSKLTR